MPDLVTASDVLDDVEDVAVECAQDDREAAGGHEDVLKRSERDPGRAGTDDAGECLAVKINRPFDHPGRGIDDGHHWILGDQTVDDFSRDGQEEAPNLRIP